MSVDSFYQSVRVCFHHRCRICGWGNTDWEDTDPVGGAKLSTCKTLKHEIWPGNRSHCWIPSILKALHVNFQSCAEGRWQWAWSSWTVWQNHYFLAFNIIQVLSILFSFQFTHHSHYESTHGGSVSPPRSWIRCECVWCLANSAHFCLELQLPKS